MDYMIHILPQDVEPDFMRAHIRCSLGFQNRHLCKPDVAARAATDKITSEEAEEMIKELEGSQLRAESFSANSNFYSIALENEKIISCTCPGYIRSLPICKHMFLAHQVTNYVISQHHAVIPARRSREPEEEETLDSQWAEKRRLAEKIQHVIRSLITVEYWRQTENVDGLDSISHESFLSATDGLHHMVRALY
ncbi:hypothetical protein M422DRAFT_253627 [Sphaerobolus stellatus SS14]|uniref:SWIM-type domain-containing protein n=1 Tax=Sphaerobolus stellatus (strain SS14) TaxID=990650 RepID=A0A0C9UJ61_SPHS4|nr:hypothetical protein M422DRAFT_253627 [Sphaerobolus stellatus SS14]